MLRASKPSSLQICFCQRSNPKNALQSGCWECWAVALWGFAQCTMSLISRSSTTGKLIFTCDPENHAYGHMVLSENQIMGEKICLVICLSAASLKIDTKNGVYPSCISDWKQTSIPGSQAPGTFTFFFSPRRASFNTSQGCCKLCSVEERAVRKSMIPSGNSRYLWRITMFNCFFFQWAIVHSYVTLPEVLKKWKKKHAERLLWSNRFPGPKALVSTSKQMVWLDIHFPTLLCAMVKPWYVCYGHLIIHPMVGILKMCVCIYVQYIYIYSIYGSLLSFTHLCIVKINQKCTYKCTWSYTSW